MAQQATRYGLVLSGGGARGFAHLGAVKALKEKGLEPSAFSGASAGSIAAAFLSDGYEPEEVLEIFLNQNLFRIIGLSIPRKGLGNIHGLDKLLKKHLRSKRIEDLRIPAFFAATDLNHGKAVYFSEGELVPRVIASASIPILFQPVIIDGIHYTDGGVVDNLPFKPLAGRCDELIGVDVNPGGYLDDFKSLITIAERVFYLSFSHASKESLSEFSLMIRPEGLDQFSWFDLSHSRQIFEAGYKSARQHLENKR